MTDPQELSRRLRNEIIANAFEAERILDGALAERLIRERHEAATLIDAQAARIADLEKALRPFIATDTQSVQETVKVIDRAYLEFSPVNVTVTKAQFLSAAKALSNE